MPILMKWTFIVNICLFCNVSGTPQIDFFEKKLGLSSLMNAINVTVRDKKSRGT